MRKTLLCVSALALVTSLSACGDGGDPAETAEATAGADDSMAMSGPFAESEMRMNEAMMAAVGVNAGDSWVRKMIAHHQGAVDMSRQVLTMNPGDHVAGMANSIIDKQTKEITALEKLVAQGTPDPASAEIYRPAMEQMHNAMMAANGADLSETFHRKMLEHHKGAVALSDIALANGVSGAVRTQVQRTRADQQKEVDMVEAMLSGEPMSEAKAAPSPAATPAARPAAPRATAAPKPTPKATARPKPSPAPSPTPTPTDPHKGHDMSKM